MAKKTLALIIGLIIVTIILFIIALRTGEQENKNKITPQLSPSIQPSPTPIAHTVLTLSPNPVEITTGEQGSVDVIINPSDNLITGVQLELSYDPLAITNLKVSPGALLENGVVFINKNDAKTGKFSYFLALQPNQKVIDKTGSVAKITFTAKSTTSTKSYLTLLPTTIVTAKGITESVLKTSSGAVINIVPTTNVTQKTTITPSVTTVQFQ